MTGPSPGVVKSGLENVVGELSRWTEVGTGRTR